MVEYVKMDNSMQYLMCSSETWVEEEDLNTSSCANFKSFLDLYSHQPANCVKVEEHATPQSTSHEMGRSNLLYVEEVDGESTPLPSNCSETLFKCGICDMMFFKVNLKDHMKIHGLRRVRGLKTHLQKQQYNSEKAFRCDYKGCYRAFNVRHELITHMEIHKEKQCVCEICNKSFENERSLMLHATTHGKPPYVCNICQKVFMQARSLAVHTKIHTTHTEACKCDKCDNTDQPKSDVNELKSDVTHKKVHCHSESFECKVCNKLFKHWGALTSHMRIHAGDRPYVCTVCDKKCEHFGDFKKHLRSHTGERPFGCNSCGKRFKQSSYLKVHMKKHASCGEHYECNQCRIRFLNDSQLKMHMNVHFNEEAYETTTAKYFCS